MDYLIELLFSISWMLLALRVQQPTDLALASFPTLILVASMMWAIVATWRTFSCSELRPERK